MTKILRGRVGMDLTFDGIGGDGSESVGGQVGMDMKFAGTGGDGTKIPSSCTPLSQSDVLLPYVHKWGRSFEMVRAGLVT